jgi:hypothetical protein
MKTPNPRCVGVWGVIGKKIEAKKPNRVSAKCAINIRPGNRPDFVLNGFLSVGFQTDEKS